MQATWQINDDGTFDVRTETVSLENCFPAFDGEAVHPISLQVTRNARGGMAVYRTLLGTVVLTFGKDADSLSLATELKGFRSTPHWVQPLAGARIRGADRIFKQGLGFGGPSGVTELSSLAGLWSLESYVTAGLIAGDESALAFGPYGHDRFLHRTTYYSREHRCGLTDRHVESNTVYCQTGFATERVPVKSGVIDFPDLHFITGTPAFDTFAALARNVSGTCNARLQRKPQYHWCSWYEYEAAFDMDRLKSLLAGLTTITPRIPLQTIQIDDGYCEKGDWLTFNNKWPGGLEPAIGAIRDAGYKAGVWIGPFMVSSNSILYKEHPDWVLKGLDGNPLVEWKRPDEDVCHLDTSHPDAFEYLRTVFTTLRSWGVSFYKTDFMDWGLKDSTACRRVRSGKTSVEYYRDVMEMIRQTIGEEAFWLGCIAPLGPMIGMVDGIRIANDVGCAWSEGGLGNMLQESVAGQYFNNVWWQNDFDTLYLRGTGCQPAGVKDPDANVSTLTPDEITSLALWDGFLGGVISTSDRLHLSMPEHLRLWRFLQPGEKRWTAALPYWSQAHRQLVATRSYGTNKGHAILFVNSDTAVSTRAYPLKELVGMDEAYCWEWMPGTCREMGMRKMVEVTLKPHQSMLVFVNTENIPPAGDLGLNVERVEGLG